MKNSIKLIALMATVPVMPAWSMSAEDLKEQALKACETSMEQVPEAHRKLALETCQCTVKKTDYAAVLAGKTEQVQADAIKNAQACAEEAGVM
ncbi:hypothetical protein [Marinicella meishanensis]|uniref:hypothetical protein n=1 Tax=Marinicella meishanensis TaxID=2873263 RepID=UPI001CBE889B|nr:hypothetical protein [Marinicella sp. NBU2979]